MTDRECRLCFALALWNGKDPHLKERLFGLTNPEGNHSEDVKEVYFYLDATPTYSYFKALYKYPQAEFPYRALREESRRRGRREPEFELTDAGVFDGDRYWDVTAEYAKASPDDILIRVGQRVGVGWHAWHCGSCDACRRGDFFACQTGVQVTGISFDGGYADYLIAPPTVSGLVRWRWAHPPSQDAARKWKPGWAREARGQQEQTAQVSLPGWL